MQNRTPVPRAERPALPDFAPVPRKTNRHDGWTPERQRVYRGAGRYRERHARKKASRAKVAA